PLANHAQSPRLQAEAGPGGRIRTDDLLITNPIDAIPVSASNSRPSDSASIARCETRVLRNGLESTSKIQISLVSLPLGSSVTDKYAHKDSNAPSRPASAISMLRRATYTSRNSFKRNAFAPRTAISRFQ